MKTIQWKRFVFAMSLAAVSAGLSAYAFLERDYLFAWDWAKPAGKFDSNRDEQLEKAALAYMDSKKVDPESICVEEWLGKDEKFIYLALGCARFSEKFGSIVVEGDAGFVATRFRYSNNEIVGMERPIDPMLSNAVRRLFPKEAARILKTKTSPALYEQRGLKKAQGLPSANS